MYPGERVTYNGYIIIQCRLSVYILIILWVKADYLISKCEYSYFMIEKKKKK